MALTQEAKAARGAVLLARELGGQSPKGVHASTAGSRSSPEYAKEAKAAEDDASVTNGASEEPLEAVVAMWFGH